MFKDKMNNSILTIIGGEYIVDTEAVYSTLASAYISDYYDFVGIDNDGIDDSLVNVTDLFGLISFDLTILIIAAALAAVILLVAVIHNETSWLDKMALFTKHKTDSL